MPRRANGQAVRTAEKAHGDALGQAQDLVERIRTLLAQRARVPRTDVDWGHVGSVAEVNRRLAAVAAFLAEEK